MRVTCVVCGRATTSTGTGNSSPLLKIPPAGRCLQLPRLSGYDFEYEIEERL